jgi:hypothetical protein
MFNRHVDCMPAATIELQLLRVSAGPATTPTPVVVVEGDIVTFHMTCADAEGKVKRAAWLPGNCLGCVVLHQLSRISAGVSCESIFVYVLSGASVTELNSSSNGQVT